MHNKFYGTGVAIVTPFNKEENVDYKSLEKLIEQLISGGVEYLVVQGTTGESVTLSTEEKIAVFDFVAEINKKRVPLVLGIGGNNTGEIIKNFSYFNFENADAILSVSPYYNKPTQEGIFRHYKTIAAESPKPIILYNVPGRTASNISSDTTLRIANEIPNIIGIKEASGDLNQMMKIIKNKPENFLVISGDDAITLPLIAAGGDGVISVVANAFPKKFSDMVRACLKGNFNEARKNHYQLLSFTEMIFSEGNPGGVKAALKILGICDDVMRLPLVNISSSLFEKIKNEIEKINR